MSYYCGNGFCTFVLMRTVKYLILFVSLLMMAGQVVAQKDDVVQFSGVIVTGDSLKPVPYASIIVKDTRRGTVSDFFGYFSFVAQKNDTIVFSSVGYKKSEFVIPDSLSSSRYSLIHMMQKDTILLHETVVYPWPTIEDFKRAFMSIKVPDDELEIIKKNLDGRRLASAAAALPMDGSGNFKAAMADYHTRMYHYGQVPPNNLLNPLAWAQFIQAWKNGDFKRKD